MLKKRIIACMDIQDGKVVKGTNFIDIKTLGDPVDLAKKYVEQGIDELVFLDISAGEEKRKIVKALVKKVAEQINIPFTVGGGIKSLEDAKEILDYGADKLSINSAALQNPELISEIANNFGNQFVTLAVDCSFQEGIWKVFAAGGKVPTGRNVFEWIKEGEERGAGEILLTCIDKDGMRNGYALELLEECSKSTNIPIIASGGAGRKEDFLELFQKTTIPAALAAGIFHEDKLGIQELKKYLKENLISIR